MIEAGPVAIDAIADMLRSHRRILVFTGAGISTGSGIPDYRGPQGVWRTRTPVLYDDFMRSDEARRRYWTQKLEDRDDFGKAEPNEVHRAIARLEEEERVALVVTQNVDGLHAAAGSLLLVEIHGTNRQVECQSCGTRSNPAPHFAAFAATGDAPVCECGGYLKPATISFGQQLRADDLSTAFEVAASADLVIALGSTLSVTPAASIPLSAAREGAPYIIVNRGATDHDGLPEVSLRVEGDVSALVPQAVDLALAEPAAG